MYTKKRKLEINEQLITPSHSLSDSYSLQTANGSWHIFRHNEHYWAVLLYDLKQYSHTVAL